MNKLFCSRRLSLARRMIGLGILLCLGVSSSAFAGSQVGKVSRLIVRSDDGLVYLFLTGTGSGKPACATIAYWMIRDEKSAAGKQQLALLMLAEATGQQVTITGTGRCERWSDGEDISEVHLIPAQN
jgi:hypothetical protein